MHLISLGSDLDFLDGLDPVRENRDRDPASDSTASRTCDAASGLSGPQRHSGLAAGEAGEVHRASSGPRRRGRSSRAWRAASAAAAARAPRRDGRRESARAAARRAPAARTTPPGCRPSRRRTATGRTSAPIRRSRRSLNHARRGRASTNAATCAVSLPVSFTPMMFGMRGQAADGVRRQVDAGHRRNVVEEHRHRRRVGDRGVVTHERRRASSAPCRTTACARAPRRRRAPPRAPRRRSSPASTRGRCRR